MKYISMKEIVNYLNIEKGDRIIINSDMKKVIYQAYQNENNADLNIFIDSVMEKIGTDGTLLIPTYNWGFCKGITYDYKKTHCETGSLGKVALKRSDFIRTKHPIYSFAVWGKDKNELYNMENTDSFGLDSPFHYMYKNNIKNIVIDKSLQECFTFVHFVEQQTPGVDYRYNKMFQAKYIDKAGNCSIREYSMFVRNLDMDVYNTINPLEENFLQNGIESKFYINDVDYKKINLGEAFKIIQDDIVNNKSRKICTYIGQ